MKKQSENQPIDDLFARKLGNMSLPPSPDGFERLQARMGQGKPETRLVFWCNPTMQGYMTAAACLLLMCLFGWLYWPSATKTPGESQVATNHTGSTSPQRPTQHQSNILPEKSNQKALSPVRPTNEPYTEQLADISKLSAMNRERNRLESQPVEAEKTSGKVVSPEINELPVIVQTKPIGGKTNQETPIIDASATLSTSERLAENTTKPTPAAERVLIVTIAEPQALVAARQAAAAVSVDDNATVALTENPQKEAKSGGLWNQIKRIKQGEVFAQRTRADDERGLIGRAYSGLKQSLDKDKLTKQ